MSHLDNLNFTTKEGFNSILIKLRYKHLSRFFKGKSCLELGCADGEGTKILLKHFRKVVAVDGSKKLIKKLENEIKNPELEIFESFFENFEYPEKFDTVILAHILEHVDNPIKILKIAKKFLKKTGILIADVPNAKSIHRQIGVNMGLLKSIYELHEGDLKIGHKRVYDMDSINSDIKKSGLKITEKGGLFLKFLSNDQLEKILNKNQIQAFDRLGQKYPEISAEIYVIAKL